MSTPIKCKTYDVYFKTVDAATFSVKARTKKEAKEIALKELNKVSKEEIAERLMESASYTGFKIVAIDDSI